MASSYVEVGSVDGVAFTFSAEPPGPPEPPGAPGVPAGCGAITAWPRASRPFPSAVSVARMATLSAVVQLNFVMSKTPLATIEPASDARNVLPNRTTRSGQKDRSVVRVRYWIAVRMIDETPAEMASVDEYFHGRFDIDEPPASSVAKNT